MLALQQKLGPTGSLGFAQAMKQKWIALDKSSGQPVVKRKVLCEAFARIKGYSIMTFLHLSIAQVDTITDEVQSVLQRVADGNGEVCTKTAITAFLHLMSSTWKAIPCTTCGGYPLHVLVLFHSPKHHMLFCLFAHNTTAQLTVTSILGMCSFSWLQPSMFHSRS